APCSIQPGRCQMDRGRHHERKLSIVQHEGQSLNWILRVKRDICPPCFQYAQECDNQFQRTRQTDSDQPIWPNAKLLQARGQMIGLLVELLVSHLLLTAGHGDAFWRLLCLPFKELMQTEILRVVLLG